MGQSRKCANWVALLQKRSEAPPQRRRMPVRQYRRTTTGPKLGRSSAFLQTTGLSTSAANTTKRALCGVNKFWLGPFFPTSGRLQDNAPRSVHSTTQCHCCREGQLLCQRPIERLRSTTSRRRPSLAVLARPIKFKHVGRDSGTTFTAHARSEPPSPKNPCMIDDGQIRQ